MKIRRHVPWYEKQVPAYLLPEYRAYQAQIDARSGIAAADREKNGWTER